MVSITTGATSGAKSDRPLRWEHRGFNEAPTDWGPPIQAVPHSSGNQALYQVRGYFITMFWKFLSLRYFCHWVKRFSLSIARRCGASNFQSSLRKMLTIMWIQVFELLLQIYLLVKLYFKGVVHNKIYRSSRTFWLEMNGGCLIGGVKNAPYSKLWVLILSQGVWFEAHMEPQLETRTSGNITVKLARLCGGRMGHSLC